MSRYGHSCSTCLHNGCCDDPCGGRYWEDAFIECDQCGRRFMAANCDYTDGVNHFCSEECAIEWDAEHAEEQEAEDGE